jgi:L-seryl-tRNA(Ser) seleniumtransferase
MSYRTGQAWDEIPVLRMLSVSRAELEQRSRRFLRRLQPHLPEGARASLAEGNSVVGGGSCPDCSIASVLLSLASDRRSANEIERRLRSQHARIIVRLENERVLLDLRTVFPAQERQLLEGLLEALR